MLDLDVGGVRKPDALVLRSDGDVLRGKDVVREDTNDDAEDSVAEDSQRHGGVSVWAKARRTEFSTTPKCRLAAASVLDLLGTEYERLIVSSRAAPFSLSISFSWNSLPLSHFQLVILPPLRRCSLRLTHSLKADATSLWFLPRVKKTDFSRVKLSRKLTMIVNPCGQESGSATQQSEETSCLKYSAGGG